MTKEEERCSLCNLPLGSSNKKYPKILQGGFHGHRGTWMVWDTDCWPWQTWCQKIHDVPLYHSSSVSSMSNSNTTVASDFILQFPGRVLRLYFCSYCLLPPFRQQDSLLLAVTTLVFITSGLCCISLLALFFTTALSFQYLGIIFFDSSHLIRITYLWIHSQADFELNPDSNCRDIHKH